MAFGRKTADEEFQETFGMSRADFDALKVKAEAAEAKVAEYEAKQTATETTLSSLQTELAALKTPRQQNQQQEPTNFFENPEQAISERLAPTNNLALHSLARVEESIARNKFEKDFRKYGKEIEEAIKNHGVLADKANPMFYENVVNLVRGRHVHEIEESAHKGEHFYSEQPGGGAPGGDPEDKNFGLSSEQIASAKRQGMSPKEFREALDYTMSNYGHTKGGVNVQ